MSDLMAKTEIYFYKKLKLNIKYSIKCFEAKCLIWQTLNFEEKQIYLYVKVLLFKSGNGQVISMDPAMWKGGAPVQNSFFDCVILDATTEKLELMRCNIAVYLCETMPS